MSIAEELLFVPYPVPDVSWLKEGELTYDTLPPAVQEKMQNLESGALITSEISMLSMNLN